MQSDSAKQIKRFYNEFRPRSLYALCLLCDVSSGRSWESLRVFRELDCCRIGASVNKNKRKQWGARTFLVQIELLFVFRLLLVLRLVRLEVYRFEHRLRHFVLPPLGYYQREVLVQLLIGFRQLQQQTRWSITKFRSN